MEKIGEEIARVSMRTNPPIARGGGGGGEVTRQQVLERAVIKVAEVFRLEGLLQHCVQAFGRGLKVDTVIEQLVWAHSDGPAEARTLATAQCFQSQYQVSLLIVRSQYQVSLLIVRSSLLVDH
jgi:hypothetical protein